MTYYKRYNEAQRNDPELIAAVQAQLKEQNSHLEAAMHLLQRAYDRLGLAKEIEEDDLDQSSGLHEARVAIRRAIDRFEYKIDRTPTEMYIGNVAASMAPDKAEELKEKYRGDTVW